MRSGNEWFMQDSASRISQIISLQSITTVGAYMIVYDPSKWLGLKYLVKSSMQIVPIRYGGVCLLLLGIQN
jgi:hypothetical protein